MYEVPYMGHIDTKNNICIDPAKTEVVYKVSNIKESFV